MPTLDDSNSGRGFVELRINVSPRSGAIEDELELKQALVLLLGIVKGSMSVDQIGKIIAQALKRAGW